MTVRPRICGIYAIIKDGIVVYVGHSANMQERWSYHRSALRGERHPNPHLKSSWRKHGEDAFEFVVLEECSVEMLLEREQHHMDQYSGLYNVLPSAGSRLGVTNSPEHNAKISASLRGNTRTAGRKLSPEHRAKLSTALKGNTNSAGNVVSEETRAKLSAATTARWARQRGQEPSESEATK